MLSFAAYGRKRSLVDIERRRGMKRRGEKSGKTRARWRCWRKAGMKELKGAGKDEVMLRAD
jgi:hypothetical protein